MMDIDEIKKVIPHRYPFLLVDKIIEMEPGKSAVGIKNVSFNEPYFQGHFPDYPVMPGVLIIESMAQVGAVSILSMDKFKGKIPLFAGINKARFKKMVRPGDTLKIKVEIIKFRGNIGIGSGKAYVGDDLAAEAEMLFAIK